MWHEARKQEKKLRDTMVDYRKRAERRRVHYEKMVSWVSHVMKSATPSPLFAYCEPDNIYL